MAYQFSTAQAGDWSDPLTWHTVLTASDDGVDTILVANEASREYEYPVGTQFSYAGATYTVVNVTPDGVDLQIVVSGGLTGLSDQDLYSLQMPVNDGGMLWDNVVQIAHDVEIDSTPNNLNTVSIITNGVTLTGNGITAPLYVDAVTFTNTDTCTLENVYIQGATADRPDIYANNNGTIILDGCSFHESYSYRLVATTAHNSIDFRNGTQGGKILIENNYQLLIRSGTGDTIVFGETIVGNSTGGQIYAYAKCVFYEIAVDGLSMLVPIDNGPGMVGEIVFRSVPDATIDIQTGAILGGAAPPGRFTIESQCVLSTTATFGSQSGLVLAYFDVYGGLLHTVQTNDRFQAYLKSPTAYYGSPGGEHAYVYPDTPKGGGVAYRGF